MSPTKLEDAPQEIAEFVAVALRFLRLEKGGANFNYPESLQPCEWAAMEGLTTGRDRAEGLKSEREKREEKRKKLEQQLKD